MSQVKLSTIQTYSVGSVVPASVDVIRAAGGAGGITLTLTPKTYVLQEPGGVTIAVYETFRDIKTDAAAGVVTFVDPNGALFNGDSSYDLVDQWQFAIFQWNGTGYDVFGN